MPPHTWTCRAARFFLPLPVLAPRTIYLLPPAASYRYTCRSTLLPYRLRTACLPLPFYTCAHAATGSHYPSGCRRFIPLPLLPLGPRILRCHGALVKHTRLLWFALRLLYCTVATTYACCHLPAVTYHTHYLHRIRCCGVVLFLHAVGSYTVLPALPLPGPVFLFILHSSFTTAPLHTLRFTIWVLPTGVWFNHHHPCLRLYPTHTFTAHLLRFATLPRIPHTYIAEHLVPTTTTVAVSPTDPGWYGHATVTTTATTPFCHYHHLLTLPGVVGSPPHIPVWDGTRHSTTTATTATLYRWFHTLHYRAVPPPHTLPTYYPQRWFFTYPLFHHHPSFHRFSAFAALIFTCVGFTTHRTVGWLVGGGGHLLGRTTRFDTCRFPPLLPQFGWTVTTCHGFYPPHTPPLPALPPPPTMVGSLPQLFSPTCDSPFITYGLTTYYGMVPFFPGLAATHLPHQPSPPHTFPYTPCPSPPGLIYSVIYLFPGLPAVWVYTCPTLLPLLPASPPHWFSFTPHLLFCWSHHHHPTTHTHTHILLPQFFPFITWFPLPPGPSFLPLTVEVHGSWSPPPPS